MKKDEIRENYQRESVEEECDGRIQKINQECHQNTGAEGVDCECSKESGRCQGCLGKADRSYKGGDESGSECFSFQDLEQAFRAGNDNCGIAEDSDMEEKSACSFEEWFEDFNKE